MAIKVIKRDGRIVDFNADKIYLAVKRAFNSVNQDVPARVFNRLLSLISCIKEDTTVESIQDMVENTLMHCECFEAAKAYILYRDKHKNIREYAQKKIDFINRYAESGNTADATIDDNSNVSNHNIAVLNAEIHKEDNVSINLKILENKLRELYPDFDASQMHKDFNTVMYLHDSSSQIGMPYCVAVSLYPFLLNGIKDLGGLSAAPKNIDSFCGMFVNLVFAIAAQYKGAVATPGFFLCMDWFCRKEWGDDYHRYFDRCISQFSNRTITIKKQIHQYFQQITYSINQPSAARGAQSVFWNVSIFDRAFYDTMYSDFQFPDGTTPNWDSFNWLQKEYLHWLNQERLKCILTFPVVSVALINQDGKFLDEDLYKFTCKEYSEGNSFFTYISDSADSLSSCCRLSSKIEKPQFNFTNGQLGEMTGSKNVITLNLNRIVQDYIRTKYDARMYLEHPEDEYPGIARYLEGILDRVYKYQTAYNECLYELFNAGMLPVYSAGFIALQKQYLTIGINGLNQAAEFLGMECNKNESYKNFCNLIFSTIKEQNTLHKTNREMFNTEFTPCESASIKMYNRDKKDGYWVPDDTNLYASYIFKPNDEEITIFDKLYLHGNDFCGDMLDGGSAAHLNLDSHLSEKQYQLLVDYAALVGCKYFTFNVPNCECDNCGFIAKQPFTKCPKCGSTETTLWDRVIGYLTAIKNWSQGRRIEQKTRVYHNGHRISEE
jgi:ribonucleoside-triphosphate reductase